MLLNESIWIKEKLKVVINAKAFHILNVGSSTLEYRTKFQPFIQQNIFSQIPNEKKNVIHLDMKAAAGVDLVGDLYDDQFLEKVKQLRIKSILCNNLLMYLDSSLRNKLAQIFFELLPADGFLIVTNSHIFPAAPDPKEAYYRADPEEMYQEHFGKFQMVSSQIVEDEESHQIHLSKQSLRFRLKKDVAFLLLQAPKFSNADWQFWWHYHTQLRHKKYSASCLFLKKPLNA